MCYHIFSGILARSLSSRECWVPYDIDARNEDVDTRRYYVSRGCVSNDKRGDLVASEMIQRFQI